MPKGSPWVIKNIKTEKVPDPNAQIQWRESSITVERVLEAPSKKQREREAKQREETAREREAKQRKKEARKKAAIEEAAIDPFKKQREREAKQREKAAREREAREAREREAWQREKEAREKAVIDPFKKQREREAKQREKAAREREDKQREQGAEERKEIRKQKQTSGHDVSETTQFVCSVCGYISKGSKPQECPVCHVSEDKFEIMKNTSVNYDVFVIEKKAPLKENIFALIGRIEGNMVICPNTKMQVRTFLGETLEVNILGIKWDGRMRQEVSGGSNIVLAVSGIPIDSVDEGDELTAVG